MNSLCGLHQFPIIDSHVHFVHPEWMDEILSILEESGCERLNLVCTPEPDGSTYNPVALSFKERHPERVFISAALEYPTALAAPNRAPEVLAGQVRSLRSRGFDGLKLIEGKPEVRKFLPYPLDGPLYAEMWAALEEEQIPVVFHVADPDEFWEADNCPDWARQFGWDYTDGSYPTKESLYSEVEHILLRYPRLKLTFAHFYFLSRQLERAAHFLDTHPTVCFDTTPHVDMYTDFSRQPEAARQFFIRYQDRILYGTDLDTRTLARGEGEFMRFVLWLVRSTLEVDGSFTNASGRSYHGLGLSPEVLEKIYHTNFERIYQAAA